ncbi:MAG: Ldh family oxidoreductase [Chloroflexi bacterium]|nr:Ldh family oxidoreductase [Chloroflexota bacterium]
MLEQFKVKEEDAIRVPEAGLRETVTAFFVRMGVPAEDAALAADVLVLADLRGVETHGVSNTPRDYLTGYSEGEINPRPDWRIVRESPATATIDCDAGIGLVIAPKAMEIAIAKAEKVGLGMVTMRNGRHLGMAAYHAMMALEHDMIGMCMTSTPASMVPTFGAEPRLGTNPIAVAAPAGKEPPFIFDAASTAVAGNKLLLARRLGTNILPGWLADENGTPIMEEFPAPEPSFRGAQTTFMLPVGGTRELGSHKGYGWASIVEVLGGILTGGGYGMNPGRPNFGHSVAAYKIDAFMDVADFKRTMDEWLETLRTTKPAPGHDRVFYPGLPEAEDEADRRANGIPLHPEVVEWFRDVCAELEIPFKLTDS